MRRGGLGRGCRGGLGDVRGLVEREFYKMDQEVFAEEQGQAKRIEPPQPAEPVPPATASAEGELTPPTYPSVFPPPEGVVAAKGTSAAPLGMEPSPPDAAEPTAAPASEPVAARPEGEPASHG